MKGVNVGFDTIREHQKKIYTLVAIVVIPSFVIFFGSGDLSNRNKLYNPVVAKIDGKAVTMTEYHQFYKRMKLALFGETPLIVVPHQSRFNQIAYRPFFESEYDRSQENKSSYKDSDSLLTAMLLLKHAEKTGIKVSDFEVTDYLNTVLFGAIRNEVEREKRFDEYCKRYDTTRAEFYKAVREWLMINKFAELLEVPVIVNSDTVLTEESVRTGTLKLEVLEINTQSMQTEKLAAYNELPEDEQESKIQAYLDPKARGEPLSTDESIWTNSKITLEYIFSPLPDESTIETSDDELYKYYESNFNRYPISITVTGGSFDSFEPSRSHYSQIQDQVKSDYIKERKVSLAKSVLSEKFLAAIDPAIKDMNEVVSLSSLMTLPDVAALGLTYGAISEPFEVTHNAVIALPDMLKHADLNNALMRRIRPIKIANDRYETEVMINEKLEIKQPGRVEEAKTYYDSTKQKVFSHFFGPVNFYAPFEVDGGAYLVRISGFEPGELRPLRLEDGSKNEIIWQATLSYIAADEAREETKRLAHLYSEQWKAGEMTTISGLIREEVKKFSEVGSSVWTQTASVVLPAEITDSGAKIMKITARSFNQSSMTENELLARTRMRQLQQAPFNAYRPYAPAFLSYSSFPPGGILMSLRLLEWLRLQYELNNFDRQGLDNLLKTDHPELTDDY